MEEEEEDARFEFEERDGRRLRFFAGEPGNYVGVTEYKGKRATSYYARASITKNKGDARRQYHIKPPNGSSFKSAVAAATAIADAEANPLGPPSPEGERKPPAPPVLICFVSDTPLRLLLHARSQIDARPARRPPDQRPREFKGPLNFLQS